MPSIDAPLPRRHLSRRGFLVTFGALSGGLALSVACGQPAAPAKPAETKPAAAPAKPAEAAKPAAEPAKPAEAAKPAAPAKPAEAAKPAASGEAPKKGGTMRVGLYVEASTMDPHLSGSKIDRQVYHNIFEPLVVLDSKSQITPGLVDSARQQDADLQAASGREVSRRHRLRC
jgi:ABC-type transport system substrate-binding protein